ncbi:MAG: Ig-like domain-containing protein [Bacteroidales bacterium]|nr:Ig-like domain-containing protein [Bacteroidales bacterium]
MKKITFSFLIALLFYACTPMDNPVGRLYGVLLDKESLSIGFGTTYTLHASVTPSRSYDKVVLLWESSDPSIIIVDQDGKVTALRHGEAMITVTASLGEKSFKATCSVEITPVAVLIPDEAFMNYCLQNFDKNDDGFLTSDETEDVVNINVSNLGIISLEGLHFFPDLQQLSCISNQLTTLDVSSNTALRWLFCYYNQLTTLDVSSNTALLQLDCDGNQLTTLDVSSNTALEYLYCANNPLTTLDVSSNSALRWLYCFNSLLTTLDVSSNPALRDLYCYYNQLTTLDVSSNPALQRLYCNNNLLTTLDVSSNPALRYLDCRYNLLTTLDVSSNSVMRYLSCRYNTNLSELWLKHGQTITNLTKDNFTEIKYKD